MKFSGVLAVLCVVPSGLVLHKGITSCTFPPWTEMSKKNRYGMVTHGSYRFPNFLFKEFYRTFLGLLNNIHGVRFFRHSLNCASIILHIMHMKQNRMMLMSLAACRFF